MKKLGWAKKIIFSLIPLFVLLLVAETVLYASGYRNPVGTPMRFGGAYKDIMLADPYTGHRFKPHQPDMFDENDTFNSNGFRDRELNTSAAVKILCLGDSTTFGYMVKMNETYCWQLEEKLNRNGGNYEVYNAGVPSYTLYQGYQLYTHYLEDTDWDYLIVTFGWNDVAWGEGGEIKTDYGIEMPPARIVVLNQLLFFARKFHTFSFLENKLSDYAYSMADKDEMIIEHYTAYYRELVREAESRGTKVIILPVISQTLQTELRVDPRMALYNNITRQVAEEEGAQYLDIVPIIYEKRGRIGWFEMIHYDSKGHEVIADTLYDYFVGNEN